MSADRRGESERLRVAVSGAGGRMGRLTSAAVAADRELLLVAEIDPVFEGTASSADCEERTIPRRFTGLREALTESELDAVVDFSVPTTVKQNVLRCVEGGVAVVVGATGLSSGDLSEIEARAIARKIPVLVVPNFAMGAVLMMRFAEEAARRFEACEIVELHHADKVDAPSGTARLTRARVEDVWRHGGVDREVAVHSVRLPGLVAHQEVIFGGVGETLTIRHDSLSRDSFMPGVLLALKRVGALQGLVVGLENIL